MTFNKKHPVLAAAALGGFILLSATYAQAQEDDDGIKLRSPIRINPFDSGMTQIDPPSSGSQPQRTSLGWDKTAKGNAIQRFSDGSTLELRPDCNIETLCKSCPPARRS